jgi:hypothetical protein
MKLLSFLGGGLWFIPLALFLGAVYSFYKGYKQSKSGSVSGLNSLPSDINVPFWKCPGTVYGYILTACTIVVLLLMYSDK